MIDETQINQLFDCDMVDANGEKIGSVKQIWLDDSTGQPLWAEVHTGLFGMKDTFVPIQDARMGGGHVQVPVDKGRVKDSPHIDVEGGHMSDAQQQELYSYYGLIPTASTGEHDRLPGGGRGTGRRRQSGAKQPRQGMTRHEEQLQAGVRDVEAGRVRLVKHVVTEHQNMSLPVKREEVRVVREPADGARQSDRDAFTDEEAEVTLHRQEAVADKTVRPVENVRLEKETVSEQQQVGGDVRKERIDVEDDASPRNKRQGRR